MTHVVTFGEVMAMFVTTDHRGLDEADRFEFRLAGAEMNVSVGLSRLGHRVRYLGAVGDDPFGVRAKREIHAEGIDVSGLGTDPSAPTGFQLKNRVHEGDPSVVYFRQGSAASRLDWTEQAEHAVRAARHLHVTGVFPALTRRTREFTFHAMRVARTSGVPVSFDPNLRPSLWADQDEMVATVNELANLADCVLPGLAEGELLTGCSGADSVAAFYLDRGANEVVTKLGADGAVLHDKRRTWHEAGFAVPVVDTVGAGDGFASGWISARLDGLTEQEALRRACAVGALATTSDGDKDGLPTRAELGALLADVA